MDIKKERRLCADLWHRSEFQAQCNVKEIVLFQHKWKQFLKVMILLGAQINMTIK